jgi:hypothetical protein
MKTQTFDNRSSGVDATAAASSPYLSSQSSMCLGRRRRVPGYQEVPSLRSTHHHRLLLNLSVEIDLRADFHTPSSLTIYLTCLSATLRVLL